MVPVCRATLRSKAPSLGCWEERLLYWPLLAGAWTLLFSFPFCHPRTSWSSRLVFLPLWASRLMLFVLSFMIESHAFGANQYELTFYFPEHICPYPAFSKVQTLRLILPERPFLLKLSASYLIPYCSFLAWYPHLLPPPAAVEGFICLINYMLAGLETECMFVSVSFLRYLWCMLYIVAAVQCTE